MAELDYENLALASCPPPNMPDGVPPIDMVEERTGLQNEVLRYLVDHIAKCLCDNLVAIGADTKKIERHLGRLVNKELKGTGYNLAVIANHLQTIAAVQTAELQIQLANLFGPSTMPEAENGTPLPAISPPFVGIERAPAPIPHPIVEPTIEVFQPPELIPPPSAPSYLQPEEGDVPTFTPEQSAAVGGGTIAVPQGLGPSQFQPEAKLPAFNLIPDLIVDEKDEP